MSARLMPAGSPVERVPGEGPRLGLLGLTKGGADDLDEACDQESTDATDHSR